jgi:uncharacterized protein (TIGR03437 family)
LNGQINPLPGAFPGLLAGAFLGSVAFSSAPPPAGVPQIACIVDAADLQLAGPVAPSQLLTIFGTGLGPAMPAAAGDYSTTMLGGVSIEFDTEFGPQPAPMLYVSSTQINFAVPPISLNRATVPLKITVNGAASAPLQLPVTSHKPSLFVVSGSIPANYTFDAVALNADGSVNSSSNPAPSGSVVSVFVNGVPANLYLARGALTFSAGGGWSVVSSEQINPFVLELGLRPPPSATTLCGGSACPATFTVYDLTNYETPGGSLNPNGLSLTGLSFNGEVYLAPQP